MKYRVNKTKRMNRNLIFLLRILIYTKYMIFLGFKDIWAIINWLLLMLAVFCYCCFFCLLAPPQLI